MIEIQIIVIIDDCLNDINGLKCLKSNSFDLAMLDPPWNIAYDGCKGSTYNKTSTGLYEDKIKNYQNWCLSWFTEVKRICKFIVFACGRQNLKMWYRISDPDDIFFWFKPNGTYGSNVATFNDAMVFLFYGKTGRYFRSNVFSDPTTNKLIPATNQFMRKYDLEHSSPKNYDVWREIIKAFKPTNVLDPFIGSGTTAQVCKELKIKYCLGYEKDDRFIKDIKYRLDLINNTKSGVNYWLR